MEPNYGLTRVAYDFTVKIAENKIGILLNRQSLLQNRVSKFRGLMKMTN